MKEIYIVGAGGFSREVAWLIEDINKKNTMWKIKGFIDEDINNIGKELNGYKVLGDISYLNNQEKANVIIAIGNGEIRKKIIETIKNHEFPILIHPSIIMSKYIEIGQGTIICAGSILTTNIKIGEHVIINLDCTIGHDSILENYSTILPSTNISGNVKVEEYATIGTGTAIIQGKNIGKRSIIGAGSVINKDIPDNSTAVGVPAKVIKVNI